MGKAGNLLERHWTVAVFVVHGGKVLLLYHRKLQKWLPPGGHVEPGETPDAAAMREVREETGIHVHLEGDRVLSDVNEPIQLVRPRGVQLETIAPLHEHIDLVYLGSVVGDPTLRPNAESIKCGWYGPSELTQLDLTFEIRQWVELVLRES